MSTTEVSMDIRQLQLLEIPEHLTVEEFETSVTSAVLEGGDSLQMDDEVRVTITDTDGQIIAKTLGQVTEIRIVKRREPGAAAREFLVRRAVIKV